MKHELLLPVGNKEMALAAIHNGADAIFLGVPGFNARGRSQDFELEELKDIIDTCHLYGVKVNLAFNIVIFESELAKAADVIRSIVPLKPDAFIVQDLGLVRLIRSIAPNQVIHGSTQMTVTNYEAINFLEDLNIKRFVLGRENSLEEIRLIKQNTHRELEVFVHGALCVSYSGQCFTSESIGGRSANRGQCAQSCRFSYELIVDGEKQNQVDRDFLVSPQDLCGIAEIPELMQIGVSSFKIEGRLKTSDYVASAASSYRSIIDKTNLGRKISENEIGTAKRKMATAYSRGFFPGWLHGVNHQQLVEGTFSSHRGYPFGRIAEILDGAIIVDCDEKIDLENGDGILWAYFYRGHRIEKGSFIFECREERKTKTLRLRIDIDRDLRLGAEMIGARVYLNHDKDVKRDLQKSWTDKAELKRVPVKIVAKLKLNERMQVSMSDDLHTVHCESDSTVSVARTAGLSDSFLQEELSSLSATVFEAEECHIQRSESADYFLSHKEIKEVRRKLCDELKQKRIASTIDGFSSKLSNLESIYDLPALTNSISENANAPAASSARSFTKLNILLREKVQVDNLCEAILAKKIKTERLDAVILDFEFGRDVLPSLEKLKAAQLKCGIATTRVLKPQEYNNLKAIEKMNPDVILVRNLGSLQYFKNVAKFKNELRGDFSLNITNHLSADYVLSKGLHSTCLSYDLNHHQVSDLLAASPQLAKNMEITVHQYMPSFHMEHCVFAAFLSKGSSFRDCGKPCERHRVELKDQFGNRHQIKADHECRNTMFNATPQTAVRFVEEWKNLGLGSIRYEALYEKEDELITKISAYLKFLSGEMNLTDLSVNLKTLESYGLSEGAISKESEYQSRKK